MRLGNTEDIVDTDEINLFLRGRMMSSMEACWRVLGYDTYPKTFPSVKTIKIKNSFLLNLLREQKKYVIFEFGWRDLKVYIQCYLLISLKKIDYSYRAPANLPQSINLQMDESPQLQIDVQYFQNIEKPVYLFRLKNDQKRIIRLNPVPLDCGEDWYFRLLAKNVPFRSFAEAYQVLGNCLSIFLIFINFLILVFINKI
jgi:hypothetical protein